MTNFNNYIYVENLREGKGAPVLESKFKERVIEVLESQDLEGSVLAERTGERPSAFKEHILFNLLKDNYLVIEGVYLVTTIMKVNSKKESRYMVLYEGELKPGVREALNYIFKESIVILKLTFNNNSLSKWFREWMGSAFSFMDIDYLIYSYQNNRVLLIEEKNFVKSRTKGLKVGYGQIIGYKELLNDCITCECSLDIVFVQNNLNQDLIRFNYTPQSIGNIKMNNNMLDYEYGINTNLNDYISSLIKSKKDIN